MDNLIQQFGKTWYFIYHHVYYFVCKLIDSRQKNKVIKTMVIKTEWT